MKKEVFISYHGGEESSYSKAESLCEYLTSKKIGCFLYKKTNEEDFYDAIQEGLLECKHFVLVACNKDLLSEWVKDEVKQFDSLRKNGEKPNSVLTAYIFGSITEKDLYSFNPVFATKDIARGENGFEKIYNAIISKNANNQIAREVNCAINDTGSKTFSSISKNFLSDNLKNFELFSQQEYLHHCNLITKRLKCMSEVTIDNASQNIIEDIFYRIQHNNSCNLFKIIGPTGTQKSYVLQMLYVFLQRNIDLHNFDPVYLHYDTIRRQIKKSGKTSTEFFNNLFEDVSIQENRYPLFIIDGVLNVIVDNYKIDSSLKRLIDLYSNSHIVLGVNQVFNDNPTRLNRSALYRGNYENVLALSPISLYDKEKCINFIDTLDKLPINGSENIYNLLNKSGLLTIDEEVVRIVCSHCELYKTPNIMDVFESEILEQFEGTTEQLKYGVKCIFDFAYDVNEINFSDIIVASLIDLICEESAYLNCIIAMYYFIKLEEYENNRDFTFFQMIFPKEITRFITAKIHVVPRYESIILDISKHYHEMTPMGKSETSFFLGRIINYNYRKEAIELLSKYYDETKNSIKQKMIDWQYNGIVYTKDSYKQDLFLLRGLSVSLIYCGNTIVLKEYIRSLIDNDLSNSINRGFHLEYYGDKRYLPNQNMLDYEDNPQLGERTLRILCNSVDNSLKSNSIHHSLLLELFTIVSLLQIRIETNKNDISFDIKPYILKCIDLIQSCFARITINDNVIESFFKMAIEDFTVYLANETFSASRCLCNEYLAAHNVKRAGWVMQNIEHPESIVEHMYSCWLIGLIYLPNDDSTLAEYDKQKILNMLLIHDLAETRLSDIPKYEKVNYPNYNQIENDTMLSILLKGTYESIGAMTPFVEAWDSWYKMNDINSKIAKDIDTIQAIYQFLVYYTTMPDKFSEERYQNWINEMNVIQTSIGRKILTQLICKNEMFANVLKIDN